MTSTCTRRATLLKPESLIRALASSSVIAFVAKSQMTGRIGDGARLRVWERGVGETRACGTGACAAAVAAARRGLTGRKVEVVLTGGPLTIEWLENGHVEMTGPVATSFHGELNGEFLS